MKPIRSLFLLAIGMMACTVHATTSAPEQKQKTTFSTEHCVQLNAVNVDYPEVDVLTYVSAFYAPYFETETFNILAFTIDDVGWKFNEVPKEVVEALTKIVLEYERTGQVPQCDNCRATCRITSRVTDGKCIVYRFECESGNSYWATYTNGQVHVTLAIVNENGNVYFPPGYPCMD